MVRTSVFDWRSDFLIGSGEVMLRLLMMIGLLGSMMVAMSNLVHAKDVSAQQAGVEYAREAVQKAEAEHQANLKKLAESEKELADAQKQVAADKKIAEASKVKLDLAKAKLDKSQTVLDQAWKQR
jgi:predicted  nucleic acid-binding Zn-ribbon protein